MSEGMIEVTHTDATAMTAPEAGLRRQVMSWTPSMMLVRHAMEKGWVVAKHSHPHEQLVYAVKGHLAFEYRCAPASRLVNKAGRRRNNPTRSNRWETRDREKAMLDLVASLKACCFRRLLHLLL